MIEAIKDKIKLEGDNLQIIDFLLLNINKTIILHPVRVLADVIENEYDYSISKFLCKRDIVYVYCLEENETEMQADMLYCTDDLIYISSQFSYLKEKIKNAIIFIENETLLRLASSNDSNHIIIYNCNIASELDISDSEKEVLQNPKNVIIVENDKSLSAVKVLRTKSIIKKYKLDSYVQALQVKAVIELQRCEYESEKLNNVQEEIADFYHKETTSAGDYYIERYKEAEKFYWFPVLKWINNLSSVHSVIDIGAAYGTLLLYTIKTFNVRRSVVIDPIDYFSNLFAAKYNVQREKLDVERTDVSFLMKFDLVIFTEVFEHLNFHPSTTLQKIKSLLAPNGTVLLTTPDALEWGITTQYYNSFSEIPKYHGQDNSWIDSHIWQYSFEEIIQILEENDFEIIDFSYAKGVSRHFCFHLKNKLTVN